MRKVASKRLYRRARSVHDTSVLESVYQKKDKYQLIWSGLRRLYRDLKKEYLKGGAIA